MSRESTRAIRCTTVSPLLLGVLLTGLTGALFVHDAGASSAVPTGTLSSATVPRPPAGEGREITWSGDGACSNPDNWAGGRVPGPTDIAHLVGPAANAHVDAAFGGGLRLGVDYTGTLHLERTLQVRNDLGMAGGKLQVCGAK
jgi:hypothetical protein